jgi:hypothetical protein
MMYECIAIQASSPISKKTININIKLQAYKR